MIFQVKVPKPSVCLSDLVANLTFLLAVFVLAAGLHTGGGHRNRGRGARHRQCQKQPECLHVRSNEYLILQVKVPKKQLRLSTKLDFRCYSLPVCTQAGVIAIVDGAHAIGNVPLDIPTLGAHNYVTKVTKVK